MTTVSRTADTTPTGAVGEETTALVTGASVRGSETMPGTEDVLRKVAAESAAPPIGWTSGVAAASRIGATTGRVAAVTVGEVFGMTGTDAVAGGVTTCQGDATTCQGDAMTRVCSASAEVRREAAIVGALALGRRACVAHCFFTRTPLSAMLLRIPD